MVSGIFILFLTAFAVFAHAEVYRWTDDDGVINFTDDYVQIPVHYRSRVIIESDTPDISVMPELPEMDMAERGDEATEDEYWTPPKLGTPEVIWVIRPFFPEHIKHKHKHRAPPLVIPTTPARNAQDKIEEQLRRNRRSLDNAQSPARKALERNEEQIRKMREGISGH